MKIFKQRQLNHQVHKESLKQIGLLNYTASVAFGVFGGEISFIAEW